VPCADCHPSHRVGQHVVLEPVGANCRGCHEDTLHRGSLGDACVACHAAGSWAAPGFDHAARFPLRGGHASVACAACHPARDFAAARRACIACHAGDDAHGGRLGRTCERCHADDGAITFDHARTRFPLIGAHRAVACADCHPSRAFAPRPLACAGCHPVPAIHEVRHVSTRCEDCHSTAGFVE
jgi:hypothetical protein